MKTDDKLACNIQMNIVKVVCKVPHKEADNKACNGSES